MNNCPKCGNPLQEGVSNCPICGTNILDGSAPAEAPAAPAPAPAPVAPAPTEPAPAAPAPVAETPAVPAETPAPAAEPAPAPSTEPVTVGAIAPTVDRIESSTPVPGIPSSLASTTVGINENEPAVANPKLAPKKSKKTVLIVAVVLLLVVGIACFMLLTPSNKKSNNRTAEPETEVALSDMASNGYHLKIAEGWELNEDGNNVILTNSESTVAIKLEHSNANLNTINANDIENILSQNESYKDVEVSSVDVSGRSAFLIATSINDFPVQIYFINGGSNLILGATIVYQSGDTKTKYEAVITEMIGSLSYSEASVKAIETVSQYSQMFGVYNNIIYNIPKEEEHISDVPEVEEEQPETPQEPEEPDEPVEPENLE